MVLVLKLFCYVFCLEFHLQAMINEMKLISTQISVQYSSCVLNYQKKQKVFKRFSIIIALLINEQMSFLSSMDHHIRMHLL